MATKKKRSEPKRQSISSSRPRSYGEIYKSDTTRQQSVPVTTGVRSTAVPATESVDWHTEYDYVLRDLRTLLIVSVVLFAVIIIAGFLI